MNNKITKQITLNIEYLLSNTQIKQQIKKLKAEGFTNEYISKWLTIKATNAVFG